MARLIGWAAGGAGWSPEVQTRADVRNTGRKGWVASAWLVAGTLALAIGSYSLSVQVAAEKREADKLAAANRELDSELKALNAELRVRMRMPQLQRWNDETFGLTPISAHQYLAGPASLADYGDELPAAAPPRVTLAVRDMAPAIAAPAPRVLLASAPMASGQPRRAVAAATQAPDRAAPRIARPEAVSRPEAAKAKAPGTVLASAAAPARRPGIQRPAIERPAMERPAEAPKDLLQQVAMLGDAPPPAEN